MQGCHVLQNEGTDPTFKMPLKPEGGHYKMADPQKQADAEHNNLPSTKCQSHLYNFQPHFFREETCRDWTIEVNSEHTEHPQNPYTPRIQ